MQGRGRIRVECYQVPEGLRFVPAEIGEGVGVGVRMPCYVFADGAVGMLGEARKSLGVGARMLADQAQKVEIFCGSLLGKFLEHFRLGFGAEHQTNFFVPGGIDLIQFPGTRVD